MSNLEIQQGTLVGNLGPTESLGLCCPQCKGTLVSTQEAYSCISCVRAYPIVLGIPDFRLFPDPYIEIEKDYEKARLLFDQGQRVDFEGLVRFYWDITPIVEKNRAERFMRHVFALVERGKNYLREIERFHLNHSQGSSSQAVLEIGCGTGGFLVAARQKYEHVVGMDIAFRWLIIAKKRLSELGLHVPLICGCAEYLPFCDGSYDLCVAESVIEHVKDQNATIRELHRVSSQQGLLYMTTPNRYSLTPEPHVRIWGVGFLPRKWMKSYVKLLKGIAYDHIRVISCMEARRILRRNGYKYCRVLLPAMVEKEVQDFSTIEKIHVAIYEGIKKIPLIRSILYLLVPFFNVLAFANQKEGKKK